MIIAIDQSLTSTGIARVFSTGRIETFLAKTKPNMSWFQRMTIIKESIEYALSEAFCNDRGIPHEKVTLAGMEGYAYDGSQRAFTLGEVGGIVKYTLNSAGLSPIIIVPQHHKMFISQDGHAEKTTCRNLLNKKYGTRITSLDASDAACMGVLMLESVRYNQGLIKSTAYDTALFRKVGLLRNEKDKSGNAEPRKRSKKPARKLRTADKVNELRGTGSGSVEARWDPFEHHEWEGLKDTGGRIDGNT